MKDVSAKIITTEYSEKKHVAELYRIWGNVGEWTYTSSDEAVVYGGKTYIPAAISRGLVTYNSKFEVSRMELSVSRLAEPIVEFIAMNPIDLVWIEVLRAFPEITPITATVVFIGQIKNVTFKGVEAKAECVSFEFYLREGVPRFRYQPACNWTLFDSYCTISSAAFKITTTAEISDDKKSVSSPLYGPYDTTYFNYGYMEWGTQRRMIVQKVGNRVFLRYPLLLLPAEAEITLYAGCDRSVSTCRDKFNNVVNFGGHPYVPKDNPTTWS